MEYPKIQSIFRREEKGKRYLIEGQYSLPEFEYLSNNKWIWTEKIDGMNTRIMWDGGTLRFGGRTDKADMPTQLLDRLQALFNTELMSAWFKPLEGQTTTDICLYGEGYGGKIQSGGKYHPTPNFILFDVRIGHWWLKREDVEGIADLADIACVPVVGSGTINEALEAVKSGFKSTFGDFFAEGLVLRPSVELRTRRGDRIITKVKHADFRR